MFLATEVLTAKFSAQPLVRRPAFQSIIWEISLKVVLFKELKFHAVSTEILTAKFAAQPLVRHPAFQSLIWEIVTGIPTAKFPANA